MYECLVGYTPFYADDPVLTCKKIMKFDQNLQVPETLLKSVSPECIDFLLSLLCASDKRLGIRGVDEIKAHPWFRGVPWDDLRSVPAPHLPQGGGKMRQLLSDMRSVDKASPEFASMIHQITANFDSYTDDLLVWGTDAKSITRKDKDNEFIGYTFKRKKDVVRTALSEGLFGYASANHVTTATDVTDASITANVTTSSSSADDISSTGRGGTSNVGVRPTQSIHSSHGSTSTTATSARGSTGPSSSSSRSAATSSATSGAGMSGFSTRSQFRLATVSETNAPSSSPVYQVKLQYGTGDNGDANTRAVDSNSHADICSSSSSSEHMSGRAVQHSAESSDSDEE
jgi:hypothetical protein